MEKEKSLEMLLDTRGVRLSDEELKDASGGIEYPEGSWNVYCITEGCNFYVNVGSLEEAESKKNLHRDCPDTPFF